MHGIIFNLDYFRDGLFLITRIIYNPDYFRDGLFIIHGLFLTLDYFRDGWFIILEDYLSSTKSRGRAGGSWELRDQLPVFIGERVVITVIFCVKTQIQPGSLDD